MRNCFKEKKDCPNDCVLHSKIKRPIRFANEITPVFHSYCTLSVCVLCNHTKK